MDGETGLVLLIALAAPCIGSFLALIADRLPEGSGVVLGRSRCDSCAAELRWFELMPIASWVAQKGRCRNCNARIGWAPLGAELAALAVALWALAALPERAWLAGLAFGWTLLLLALIDLRTMRLPDLLTMPLLAGGLLAGSALSPDRLPEHALGAAAGFASLAALALLYQRARGRAGLGGGDAKLFAAIGAWIGWTALPSALLFAGVAGLVHAACRGRGRLRGSDRIPFGPALALGGWIVWLHGALTWS